MAEKDRLVTLPECLELLDAQVRFDEGDGVHTASLGVVTRVWPNRKYVTLRSDGRTFTRLIERVTRCG